ncbi:MAG: hypothetical protein FJ280_17340 [Planctomycetes bacterium]|nr:hypothetical protein [Planctomycetota bacterium]
MKPRTIGTTRRRLLSAGLLACLLAGGCAKKDSGKEVQIGAIFPLSGEAQRIGNMKKDGADLAVQMINAGGGINGSMLAIVYEDSRNQPAEGVASFNRLTRLKGVEVVMSAMSGVSMALVPLAEKQGKILFANVGHPQITGSSKWVFRHFPTADQEAERMVTFAVDERGLARAGILYPNDDWGSSGRDAFKKALLRRGGQIAAEESYEKSDSDFRTQLVKIANANPDILYFTGIGNALAIIARQSTELGLKCFTATTTGFNDKAIIDLAGSAAENVHLTTSAFDPQSSEAEIEEFVAAFQVRFGRLPAFDEALQFDSVQLIAAAIRTAGNRAADIRTELAQMNDFHGVCGKTSVDEDGNFRTPIQIRVVRSGRAILLAE